jgi:hypothetical protein
MDHWHVILAGAGGVGWGLAVGWRNARDVALGRVTAPEPPPAREHTLRRPRVWPSFGEREEEAA